MLLIRSDDTMMINFVKTWTLRFSMEIKAGLNLMKKEFREIWMNFDAHFGTEGVVIKKKKKTEELANLSGFNWMCDGVCRRDCLRE